MSELNQSQGEQPAQDEAPGSTGAPAQVDAAAINADIENASPEEIAKALGFDVDETAPEQDDEGNPTPPAQPEAQSTPGEQPANEGTEGNPDDEGQPAEKPASRRRLSVTGLPDTDKELNAKAISLVRDGKAATLFEAMKSLVGEQGQPADANGDESAGDDSAPPPEAPPTLQELEDRFEQASEELAAAIRDFDQEKQIELNKEIALLNRKIVRAEQAATVQQAEVSNYQAEYAEAVTEMESQYAELLDDENSPFADLLEDRIEAARARRDPALADPRHVLKFAEDLATALRQVPAKKERTPVPPPPRKEPSGSALAPSGKAKPQLTSRQAEEFIDKANAETLAAALWPA